MHEERLWAKFSSNNKYDVNIRGLLLDMQISEKRSNRSALAA